VHNAAAFPYYNDPEGRLMQIYIYFLFLWLNVLVMTTRKGQTRCHPQTTFNSLVQVGLPTPVSIMTQQDNTIFTDRMSGESNVIGHIHPFPP